MFTRLYNWLHRIPLTDAIQYRQAQMFQFILLIIMGGCLAGIGVSLLSLQRLASVIVAVALYPVLLLTTGAAFVLLRQGQFRLAVTIAVAGLISGVGTVQVLMGMAGSSITFLAFSIPIVIAGLLLDRNGLLFSCLGALGCISVSGVLDRMGVGNVLGVTTLPPTLILVLFAVVALISLALCIDRFGSALRLALIETANRERELVAMRDSLEATVVQRTGELQDSLAAVQDREARLRSTVEALHDSRATIQTLTTPIIRVLPHVLLVPLTGSIQETFRDTTVQTILTGVTRHNARHLILDVTGVTMIDTQMVQSVLHTVRAVRLIGTEVSLVGVNPEIAQTIVMLGIDVQELHVYRDLSVVVQHLSRSQNRV